MTLFYVSAARIPSRAANSIHVMKMCQAFAENNIQTYLVAAKKSDETEKNIANVFDYYGVKQNFKLLHIPWLSIRGYAGIYSMLVFLHYTKVCIINRSIPVCFGRFPLGLYVLRVYRPKMALEVHAPIPKKGIQSFLMKGIIRDKNFKFLVVISDALKQIILADFPELEDKIVVSHDGADVVDIDIQLALPDKKTNTFHCGYIGHLYQGRGIETLLTIAKNIPELHMHLVGGLPGDIEYWKQQSKLIPNITIHGFLPPSKTAAFRNSMDMLIAPYESRVSVYKSSMDTSKWMSPLKIFEYMSAKKPIFCSDIAVLREVLRDNDNAILCDPDDSHDWIVKIKSSMKNPELLARIQEKAYQDFITHYTWNQRAKKISEKLLL